ncbi:MAG: stage II sporulation protein M [Opitutae bacterium]|nr:stage II sporulation protein M [Opitutae bacterium]
MIVDLPKFVAAEEPYWRRLEKILERRREDPWGPLSLAEAKELDYLYRRAGADLARVASFSAEPEMRRRLEQLVARAYAEIHGTRREGAARLRPWRWLSATLPQTLRRHARALWLTVIVTMVGVVFGAVAVAVDPEAKEALMPFSHLRGDPADRVAEEERAMTDKLSGHKATFAGHLMTHNTQVTLFALALGIAWGAGTIVLLFYNGVILGAVMADYLLAGQGVFLAGWLLPHGVIEIPAILVGATGGFVLARAVIGRDDGRPLAARLRAVADDVATLAAGAALMLVWAGFVESYLSQYHEPAIPYALKIAFGVVEAGLLVAYYGWAGRAKAKEAAR